MKSILKIVHVTALCGALIPLDLRAQSTAFSVYPSVFSVHSCSIYILPTEAAIRALQNARIPVRKSTDQ
jgi:hypothetical protein